MYRINMSTRQTVGTAAALTLTGTAPRLAQTILVGQFSPGGSYGTIRPTDHAV